MSSIRTVASLPLARSVVATLIQKGFRVVSDLQGIKPLDLSQELGVSPQIAAEILAAIEPSKNPVSGVSAKDLFKDPTVGKTITAFPHT